LFLFAAAGIKRIYGIVGDSLNGLTDAIRKQEKIEWLHVREGHQSSGPLRYAIVDGMNVRDSRVHNYPPRWNAAPSQELLVIRRNPPDWRGIAGPAA
jgi:hypothetical protein